MAPQVVLDEINLVDIATQSDVALAEATERGLPTESIAQLRSMGLTFAEVGEIVIPPRTLKHRKTRGERLTGEESERLLRVVRILTLADKVFGDHTIALHYLRGPDYRRLNGRNCLQMLRTEAGGRLIESMLWGIDEGVYT
jgi:putative toxin-antitoxin system antitoxin component (TIGR02293 family)